MISARERVATDPVFNALVHFFYDAFERHCDSGAGITPSEVRALASGRGFTGARSRGLPRRVHHQQREDLMARYQQLPEERLRNHLNDFEDGGLTAEELAIDVLATIRHFVHFNGLDWDLVDGMGEEHYRNEREAGVIE